MSSARGEGQHTKRRERGRERDVYLFEDSPGGIDEVVGVGGRVHGEGGRSAGRGEWDKWIAGLPTISTPSGESGGLSTQAIVAVQLGAQRVPSNPTTRSNSGRLLASGKNNPATPRQPPPPGAVLHHPAPPCTPSRVISPAPVPATQPANEQKGERDHRQRKERWETTTCEGMPRDLF